MMVERDGRSETFRSSSHSCEAFAKPVSPQATITNYFHHDDDSGDNGDGDGADKDKGIEHHEQEWQS